MPRKHAFSGKQKKQQLQAKKQTKQGGSHRLRGGGGSGSDDDPEGNPVCNFTWMYSFTSVQTIICKFIWILVW